jgi:iron complex outermembrane receptor protein
MAYNSYGDKAFIISGSASLYSSNSKMFINDKEVSPPFTSDLMTLWGDMPLDFVSHIEVYTANGAIAFGNEPASLIIRVYTKKPERQRGSILRMSSDNKGQGALSAYFGDKSGKVGYSIFVNASDYNNDEINFSGKTVSRGYSSEMIFGSIDYDSRAVFELMHVTKDKDRYLGFALDMEPDYGRGRTEQTYFNSRFYLLEDKSLKLGFSYEESSSSFTEKNSEGLYVAVHPLMPMNLAVELEYEHSSKKYETHIQKDFQTHNNKLLIAADYKKVLLYRSTEVKRFFPIPEVDSVYEPFDKYELYSARFEDSFSFNDSNMLIAGMRYDRFNANSTMDSKDKKTYRAGLITLPTNEITLKLFYTKSFVIPDMIFYESAATDLDFMDIEGVTAEASYKSDNLDINFITGSVTVENIVKMGSDNKMVNGDESTNVKYVSLGSKYTFSPRKSIEANVYKSFADIDNTTVPDSGGWVKAMYAYGDWSFYGEGIYTVPYSSSGLDIDAARDITLSASYNFTDDFSATLKGYNIFDQAMESPYVIPMGDTRKFCARSRTVELSLRWVF